MEYKRLLGVLETNLIGSMPILEKDLTYFSNMISSPALCL